MHDEIGPFALRCPPPGKARHGQVETSPVELHRAAFAGETGAESSEYSVRLLQDPPEAVDQFGVVGRISVVMFERYGILHFDRDRPDLHVNIEPVQALEDRVIKLGHRTRSERDSVAPAVVRGGTSWWSMKSKSI